MSRLSLLTLSAVAAGLASSSALAPPIAAVAAKAVKRSAPSPAVKRGLNFAQGHCAGCHALESNQGSPNPEAPPFEAIANQRGLTRLTLSAFLRDSHNYPAAMNFTIDPAGIDDLTSYILTLRSSRYRPAI